MQIGGLGGSHSTTDHHVTNCIHDHRDTQKDSGGMAMKSSAAAELQGAKSELQQEGTFSLAAWLKNTLGNGKGLLLNFWTDGQAAEGVEGNKKITGDTTNGQTGTQAAVHTSNSGALAVAETAAQPTMQKNTINNGSYDHAAPGMKKQKRAFRQRARAYFHNMSGRLDSKRSKKNFGVQTKKTHYQTRRESSGEENLRRHNRCRDTVEISFASTEDDFLMDSYDRKGEYSQLTTKK